MQRSCLSQPTGVKTSSFSSFPCPLPSLYHLSACRNLSGKLIATRAAGKHGTKPHKSVEDTVKHQHDRGASHKNERASESREYLRDSRYSLL